MFRLSRNRLSSGFAQIPNAVLRDTELSARARGVLCYMLSHADGFEITRQTLQGQFTEGRDAIDTALRELRESGYLRTERMQGDQGRFLGAQYLVFDQRGAADADEESQSPGNPHTEAPETTALETRATGNPQLYKNTNSLEHQLQENKENTTRKRERVSDAVLVSVFERWWQLYPRRVAVGSARPAFVKAARKLGDDYEEILFAGVARLIGWVQATSPETRHIPHASTWLNQERWADVSETARPPATAAERMAQQLPNVSAAQPASPFNWGGTVHAIER